MKKISESAWGDMMRRSSGEIIRKEDDVNLLDVDGLYDYIKSKYEKKVFYIDKDNYGKLNKKNIVVDVIDKVSLFTYYDEDDKIEHILLSWSKVKIRHSFMWTLTEKFSVKITDPYRRIIKEKDDTCTNQTYIDLIDFFLENMDSIVVNESAWGDMMRRSSGDIIRKEDEVLQKIQKALASYIDMFASIEYTHEYSVGSYSEFKAFIKDFKDNPRVSSLDYDMEDLLDYTKEHWDDTVLPAIEDAIDNLNKQIDDIVDDIVDDLNSQNVNESAWGDMMRRSSGDIIRKEDELTDEEMETLKQYISHYAYEIVYGEGRGTEACKLDEFCDFLERNMEADPKIIDYVKTFWIDEICDLVDDAIEERQNDPQEEYVNESAWGDMMRRSSGESVREEDFTEEFIDKVESELRGFTMLVVYYIKNYELTFDGFYKYLEEIENPDEIKKIINYVKTHKNKCDKLLEKDIKFENKYLDEKVNGYLLRFVDNIVYDEKYHNTFSDIKKFASEFFKGHESPYYFNINEKHVFKDKSELFNDYIEDKWKDGSLKQKIDDLIKNENDEISKYGFVKEPGKTISETVDDWWYSLDEKERNDLGWDEFGDDAEEEYYTDHNPKYNEYDGEDFDADEWWNDAWGIRRVKIYCSEHSKTNESAWGDMMRRSSGESVRKEDILDDNEIHAANELITMYCRQERVNYIQHKIVPPPPSRRKENDLLGLVKYIEGWRDQDSFKDIDFNKIIRYIKNNWERLDIDKFIKKWIFSPKTMEGKMVFECEGVPGGATPASVGGMGAAYFPGPDGTPGSGDLPSPTGIVYHQVAPYTIFLKELRKKKKKKTKKFRKEDEPCVHSPNAKVYDYVDDFREYVDRTYNNMDRRR